MQDSILFLETLFEDKPDDLYILIWTLPDKMSIWLKTPLDFEKYFIELLDDSSKRDIYYGVGLSPKNFGSTKRCPAEKISAIPGLWIDIDVKDSVHKKKNLPDSLNDALSFLNELPLKPSIVINSGHGLQALWLFKELWVFDSEEDRKRAIELSAGWNAWLNRIAHSKGWTLDATHDLSRILRLPGSINWKSDPKRVEIINSTDIRYNPFDFEPYIITGKPLGKTFSVQKGNIYSFILDQNASPPFDKFQALAEAEPKFMRSWKKERSDLPSQSEFDMSLASFAAMAGWSDQEIVNLIIAHRRLHGTDLKLRYDYYGRLIDKVRSSIRGTDIEPHDLDKEEALRFLRAELGIPIVKVIKRGIEPAIYSIVIENEGKEIEVIIGTVRQMLSQSSVRAAIYEFANVAMDIVKTQKWNKMVALMSKITEYIETRTRESEIREWIKEYIENLRYGLSNDVPWTNALNTNSAFMRDNRLWIHLDHFREWIKVNKGISLEHSDVSSYMSRLGFVRRSVSARIDTTVKTRNYWASPENWKPETHSEENEA